MLEPRAKVKYKLSDCKKISCMQDFYEVVGLWDSILGGEITNVSQVHMERENCEAIKDIIAANLRKSKRFKKCTDRYINTIAAMDWLNYSPVSNISIPKDELWVYGLVGEGVK